VFIPEYIDSERLVQYLPFHLGWSKACLLGSGLPW
jgi:hypothetical protein